MFDSLSSNHSFVVLSSSYRPLKERMSLPSPPVKSFLHSLVIHPVSNKFISSFQALCGIDIATGRIKNYTLYYLFKFSSMTGDEMFALLPLIIWFAFPVAIRVIMDFVLLLLSGQILKDIFQLPRPPEFSKRIIKQIKPTTKSTPSDTRSSRKTNANKVVDQKEYDEEVIHVVKVEKSYETEYGLPSTHALSAFLPLTALYTLLHHKIPFHWGWWFAAWGNIALISMSRLYLGVHSPTDIIFAIVMGISITQTTRVYGNVLDEFICSTNGGAIVLLTLLTSFITVYPRAMPWRAAYGGAATIFGTWFGVFLGFQIGIRFIPHVIRELYRSSVIQPANIWYNSHLFPTASNDGIQYNREMLSSTSLWLRLITGTTFLLIVKLLSKYGASVVFMWLANNGYIKPRLGEDRDVLGQPVPLKQSYGVEVNVRLVSYICVGCSAVLGSALLWHYSKS